VLIPGVGDGDRSSRLSIASADDRRRAGRRSDGGGGGGLIPFVGSPFVGASVKGVGAASVGLNAAAGVLEPCEGRAEDDLRAFPLRVGAFKT
jgi:hypothetical protein